MSLVVSGGCCWRLGQADRLRNLRDGDWLYDQDAGTDFSGRVWQGVDSWPGDSFLATAAYRAISGERKNS